MKKTLQEWRTKRCRDRKSAARAQREYEELWLEPRSSDEASVARRCHAKIRLLIAIERSRGSKVTIRRMEAHYKELQTGLTT